MFRSSLIRITPKELNPEEITFLDPACGSGHILVEAYDMFKEIYLERGYRTRIFLRLILGKESLWAWIFVTGRHSLLVLRS